MQTMSFVTLSVFSLFSVTANAILQDSTYKQTPGSGQYMDAWSAKSKGNASIKAHLTYTKTPQETGPHGSISSNNASRNYWHTEMVTRETMYVDGKMNMR